MQEVLHMAMLLCKHRTLAKYEVLPVHQLS